MPVNQLTHDELTRIYGPWIARTPRDAARLFDGYRGRWWIAGGWAIEAFTGVSRPHGDLDPSIPRHELPCYASISQAGSTFGQQTRETLRILLPGDVDGDALAESCENVWARGSGGEPWEYDIILMGITADTWVFKRDFRISRPVEEIVWSADGVPYLRPEVQLLHKAGGRRAKDQSDFDASWPLLEPADRRWLREAIELAHPGHRWLEVL